MSHRVYKIFYPGPTRERVAILIEKGATDEQYIFAVKGDLDHGMCYVTDFPLTTPKDKEEWSKMRLVGIVSDANLVRFAEGCAAVEPPFKQYDSWGKKLYPDRLTRRSKEWVEEVLMMLRGDGILENEELFLLY